MKGFSRKTSWWSIPLFALSMALVASTDAQAGLLASPPSAAKPQVYEGFVEFASFDSSTFELRELSPDYYDSFGESPGMGEPSGKPQASEAREGLPVVEMSEFSPPPADSGAGATSSGQGPSGQQAGSLFSSHFPPKQPVVAFFAAERKASLPAPIGTRLFRPPRV